MGAGIPETAAGALGHGGFPTNSAPGKAMRGGV